MHFELNIPEFTGPIEALLTLIERRKLPINDVSLSEVTEEYLNYIALLDTKTPIAQSIHFVYIASTLTLIKSKSLLPSLELTESEESDVSQLKQRLALYQQYQALGLHLGDQLAVTPSFFFAKPRKKSIVFSPHEDITGAHMITLLHNLYTEMPEKPKTKQEGYVKIAVHIEELMDSLIKRVQTSAGISFQTFLQQKQSGYTEVKEQKVVAVVGFLALLEVVRNHGLAVNQEHLFADITVHQ